MHRGGLPRPHEARTLTVNFGKLERNQAWPPPPPHTHTHKHTPPQGQALRQPGPIRIWTSWVLHLRSEGASTRPGSTSRPRPRPADPASLVQPCPRRTSPPSMFEVPCWITGLSGSRGACRLPPSIARPWGNEPLHGSLNDKTGPSFDRSEKHGPGPSGRVPCCPCLCPLDQLCLGCCEEGLSHGQTRRHPLCQESLWFRRRGRGSFKGRARPRSLLSRSASPW